jgi:hypothetical protein
MANHLPVIYLLDPSCSERGSETCLKEDDGCDEGAPRLHRKQQYHSWVAEDQATYSDSEEQGDDADLIELKMEHAVAIYQRTRSNAGM